MKKHSRKFEGNKLTAIDSDTNGTAAAAKSPKTPTTPKTPRSTGMTNSAAKKRKIKEVVQDESESELSDEVNDNGK
jgi:hypothetical protein